MIAERFAWPHSMTVLKDRVRAIRPEYRGVDPADRIEHKPGDTTQCDLWFPKTPIPLGGGGQSAQMPVLVMTLAFSRFISATMIPSRMAGDFLAGMWLLLGQLGAVTHRLSRVGPPLPGFDEYRRVSAGQAGPMSRTGALTAGAFAVTDRISRPSAVNRCAAFAQVSQFNRFGICELD